MTEPCTVPTFLRRGMGWGPLATPPQPIPGGAHCALTGAHITHGYPVADAIPASTGNLLDVLPGGPAGWLSEDAAICYRNDWNLGARLVFEDGTMFYPLLNAAQAAQQGRPAWRDLVRDELPRRTGQRCLCLLNTDPKKRTWPFARVAVVGEQMSWHVNEGKLFGVFARRDVSLTRLRAALDLAEEVYTHYPKTAILSGLWSAKLPPGLSWSQMSAWETALAALRPTSEFLISLIVAQKKEK